ncbi:hypothetical protein PF004_g11090 [Phytophthora fragariae]|uniref:Kinesin motor domain-containing protein n=1 Tax=Phytophthora fragariae TaxID=53985 RepID=A0A6G0NZ47_9STRA|nr:hypothetical protein PF004_g11090 [Phytophthora fragariae]
MQRRSLQPPPAPSSLRQSSDSDEDADDHHSSSSAGETRVQPLTVTKPRKDGSVQVAVRIRPMLPRELARNAATCVERQRGEDNVIRLVPTAADLFERKFTFDHVFPQSTKQTELYDEALKPWMASFLQGFNVTVIAYGQTGSGKTHTMGNSMPSTSTMANSLFARSPSSDDSSDEEAADTLDSDEGLIPRFLHHLFTKLNESGSNFQLSVSFLEIYGEDIHDLLDNSDAQRASRRSEPLQLRENKKNGVWVQGLTEVPVSNRHEAMEQMQRGALQRITASTQMNERSSRSHAVYTVKIVQRVSEHESKKDPLVPNNQEMTNRAAEKDTGGGSSKLTRLLQDALGGNSRTLFIACVSPADINANETLNTLQYANRAKNIQNKAVKNIDSRSAELASLKAFNHLLSRELVKAIVTGLGEGVPGDVDRLTDSCMGNPKVLAYLSKIEQFASSGGLESSTDERLFETRHLLDCLTAHLHDLAPNNGYRRAASLASISGDETKSIEPQEDYLDLMSDSGSSVALLEDQKPSADAAFVTPYPLGKLCRTLEVMNLAFEMQEIQQVEKRQRESLNAKTTKIEARYHRHELLRNGLSDMIERMRTWLSSPVSEQEPGKRRSIERTIGEAMEKLELMDIEMEEMHRHKTELTQELEVQVLRCRQEWKTKQEHIEQLREVAEDATTNALNVLTRRTEIKVRFDEYDLDSISRHLKDEEKEMATFIDEDDGAISYMSPLFTKEELSSAYSRDVLSSVQDQLRIAFDKEALEASMNKELRKRAQLFKNITSGLMSCHSGEMTEQEFMAKNEQNLKDCEDSISQIRDAMRARRDQRASMATILDSITNLDAAKDVIRRLIVEIFSHWRIYMVFDEEEDMRQRRESEEAMNQNLAEMKFEMEKKVEDLEAKYEKDVQCAFQMVTSFNDAVGWEDFREHVKSAVTPSRVAALEERERVLLSQLAEREDEMKVMRAELGRFQASAKSVEMKEESFRLMNRCQEIWKELGLNEEDQASKFQDINELLVRKCSEELKDLEGAREKLQSRIDTAYRVISRMESILHVQDPVDVSALSTVAGVTLLEQEAHLLALQKRLANELLCRVKSRVRVVEGIQELADGLQIRSTEDFRHVSRDEVGSINDVLNRSSYANLDTCRRFQQNPDSALVLEQLLDSLDEAGTLSIASCSIQQEELLFNVLLKEKAKRITELEESLKAIRSVAHQAQLSQEDIVSIIHTLLDADSFLKDVEGDTDICEELSAWILQTGGQLDVSTRGLEVLAKALRGFQEVHAGRNNALEFLHRTLEEGAMLAHGVTIGEVTADEAQGERQPLTPPLHPARKLQESECFIDTLAAGKNMMQDLDGPVERSLRSLFYSMNDDFEAFGIDTEEQRVSFFLGCKDDEAQRSIIERYAVFSSCSSSGDEEEEEAHPVAEMQQDTNDSFLSKLDPAFNEFHWFYSVSFGELQTQKLRELVAGMAGVKSAVKSAQNRLQSLQKIMKIFNKINEFKAKIAEFEASASQKDRLFGNSLRLLEEERFRKMAAKHYPNLLAALRKEVSRWLENEDGEYDLSVLGEDLKNLLLDMMNTDTGLMHLDLGTVRRPTKPALTPNSSSSNLQVTSSGSGQRASTPARARTQSQNDRAHASRARSLNFD